MAVREGSRSLERSRRGPMMLPPPPDEVSSHVHLYRLVAKARVVAADWLRTTSATTAATGTTLPNADTTGHQAEPRRAVHKAPEHGNTWE